MAVTGWTERTARTWSGTESPGPIEPSSTGTYNGFITRDANDGVSDFTFEFHVSTMADSGYTGGAVFCFGSSSAYYSVTWELYWSSVLYLKKNDISSGSVGSFASYVIDSSGAKDTTFKIKIEKSGSTIDVYYADIGASFSGTPQISATDSTYSSGDLGFGYPNNWSSLTDFYFDSVTVPGATRRIFIM